MSKGIIIYRSKYGAAKKYAGWMMEKTGFDLAEMKMADPGEVGQYDVILLFGGIHASGISGLSFLKKHINQWKDKKIAVFCVGASPWDETAFQAVKKHNMKGSLEKIPVFYGRGAWDQKAMTFVDRTLCNMLQKSVAKKDPSQWEPWMEALMCARGKSCDWTDPAYLTPLLEYLEA